MNFIAHYVVCKLLNGPTCFCMSYSGNSQLQMENK